MVGDNTPGLNFLAVWYENKSICEIKLFNLRYRSYPV